MLGSQVFAGRFVGVLLRLAGKGNYTDMGPLRAIRRTSLEQLHMSELTYGWNLEMQMRVAAAGWRLLEIPVDHCCRRGGVSKVSGNLAAGFQAGWKITTTFMRLAWSLRRNARPEFATQVR